jgi:hypothetical protein
MLSRCETGEIPAARKSFFSDAGRQLVELRLAVAELHVEEAPLDHRIEIGRSGG